MSSMIPCLVPFLDFTLGAVRVHIGVCMCLIARLADSTYQIKEGDERFVTDSNSQR